MKLSTSVVKAFTFLFVVVLFIGFISPMSEKTQADEGTTTEPMATTEASTTEPTTAESTTAEITTIKSTTALATTKKATTSKATTKKKTTTTAKPADTTVRTTSELSDTTTLTNSYTYAYVYVTDVDGSRITQMDEFGSMVDATSIVYETTNNIDLQDETHESEKTVYNADDEKKNITTQKVVLIVLIIAATIGAAAFALSFLGNKK